MLGKNLSEALGGIADDKIEAAANLVPVQRRPLWVRVAACAAVLALLIGAMFFWPGETKTENGQIIETPGILKVYANEADLTAYADDVVQQQVGNGVSTSMAIWSPFTSVAGFGIPLTFSIPEDFWGDVEVTFDISADYGFFLNRKNNPVNLGSNITIANQDKVYWRGTSIGEIADSVGENGNFYVDIIIRADGEIAGYGVIAFAYVDYSCVAYGAATVCFPMVDGEMQNVTEEYVRQQLEKYKVN